MAKKSLGELMATETVDRAKIEATTEDDIRRHMIEDGEDPDAPLSGFVLKKPGQRGLGRKPAKVQIALRVDPETLAIFRASGPGWQTRAVALLQGEARRLKRTAG